MTGWGWGPTKGAAEECGGCGDTVVASEPAAAALAGVAAAIAKVPRAIFTSDLIRLAFVFCIFDFLDCVLVYGKAQESIVLYSTVLSNTQVASKGRLEEASSN